MKQIRKVFTLLQRRGTSYIFYLFSGWFIPSYFYKTRHHLPGRFLRWWTSVTAARLKIAQLLELTSSGPKPGSFTSWSSFGVEPAVRKAVEAARSINPKQPLTIGRLDHDGRLHGLYGPLPGFVCVKPSEFAERERFGLCIVLWEDDLLISKDYRGDSDTFAREWSALINLAGKVNVPTIHSVDVEKQVIYKNLICGRTIREKLVEHGARILHEHAYDDDVLRALDSQNRTSEVLRRGRSVLKNAVADSVITQLASQLEECHRQRVFGVSFTWGNVVIDEKSGSPWFIDLDKAATARKSSSLGMALIRDDERERFNNLYGTALLTETSARQALHDQSRKLPGWYAPIDFGLGLSVGGFWSITSGTGRWECVNGPVLNHLVSGKRILDLGSNNGIMPVMMLRNGAQEVLGVELSADFAAAAELVRRLFEWRDERSYNLRLHLGNMLDILNTEWGRFDIITAYCSLYYLEPNEMAAVVRKSAQLAPMMVLQAKTDTRSDAPENKATKSSLSFLKTLLEENGFPHVELVTPQGFTRPLLIARTATFPRKTEVSIKS